MNHVPKGYRNFPAASADFSHEAYNNTLLILYYEYPLGWNEIHATEGEESVSIVIIAWCIYDVLYRLKL